MASKRSGENVDHLTTNKSVAKQIKTSIQSHNTKYERYKVKQFSNTKHRQNSGLFLFNNQVSTAECTYGLTTLTIVTENHTLKKKEAGARR